MLGSGQTKNGEKGEEQKQHDYLPTPPYSHGLAPCSFSVSLIKDKTERPPF
jgi:hypothetical protein